MLKGTAPSVGSSMEKIQIYLFEKISNGQNRLIKCFKSSCPLSCEQKNLEMVMDIVHQMVYWIKTENILHTDLISHLEYLDPASDRVVVRRKRRSYLVLLNSTAILLAG